MKYAITIGMVMLLLASGFIFVSGDRTDDGVKILNDDEIEYSEPTHSNGEKIKWKTYTIDLPIKKVITKDEWNNIFKDYRSGDTSKEETIKLIKDVNIEW